MIKNVVRYEEIKIGRFDKYNYFSVIMHIYSAIISIKVEITQ